MNGKNTNSDNNLFSLAMLTDSSEYIDEES